MSQFAYHGNGTLRIAVMKNPFGEWNSDSGDRHLFVNEPENYSYLEINPDEWYELFFNVLELPQGRISRNEDEESNEYNKRIKDWFQEVLTYKGYKMLGRIYDMYEDTNYLSWEIDQLLNECLEIGQKTLNKKASSFLEKLIIGCKEALKVSSGLCLISD